MWGEVYLNTFATIFVYRTKYFYVASVYHRSGMKRERGEGARDGEREREIDEEG